MRHFSTGPAVRLAETVIEQVLVVRYQLPLPHRLAHSEHAELRSEFLSRFSDLEEAFQVRQSTAVERRRCRKSQLASYATKPVSSGRGNDREMQYSPYLPN